MHLGLVRGQGWRLSEAPPVAFRHGFLQFIVAQ